MQQEVGGSLAPMEGQLEAEPVASTSAQSKVQTQKATHKELQFDARYGWTYDQYFDPVELAYSGGRGRFAIGPLLTASFHLTVAMIAVLEEVSSKYAVRGLKYTRKAAIKATGRGLDASGLRTLKTPASKQPHKRKGLQLSEDPSVQTLTNVRGEKEAASMLGSSEASQKDGDEIQKVSQQIVKETVQVEAEATKQQELLLAYERDLLNGHPAEKRGDEEVSQPSIVERPLTSSEEIQQVAEGAQALENTKDVQSIGLTRTKTLQPTSASSRRNRSSELLRAGVDSDAAERGLSAQGDAVSSLDYLGGVQIAGETDAFQLSNSRSQETGSMKFHEGIDEQDSVGHFSSARSLESGSGLLESQRRQKRASTSQILTQQGTTQAASVTKSSKEEELRPLRAQRDEAEDKREAKDAPHSIETGRRKEKELALSSRREKEPAEVAPVTIWSITEGFDRRSLKMLAEQSAASQGAKNQRRRASEETRGVVQRHSGRRYRVSEVPRRASREQSSNRAGLESLSMSH